MFSFNKIILIGNLTKDPELRYMPNGNPVTTLRIAVNHKYKRGNESKEDVMFIDVILFGKQAESCAEYLEKGRRVLVDGRLHERRWETEDGQARNKYEVIAQNIKFMSERKRKSSSETYDESSEPEEDYLSMDDVPF